VIDPHFVILGAVLSVAGALGYSRETLLGHTRPNRVTWLIWALAPLIAFVAQLSDGVGLPSILTFSVGFGPLLVFLASFAAPAGHWHLGPVDLACGALSALALIGWLLSGSGTVAIALGVAADGLAAIPTLIKAVRAPETEHHGVFRNATLNAGITLLAIQHWTFSAAAFPIYIFMIGAILYFLVRIRPHRRQR
jgi:hypothetical protein